MQCDAEHDVVSTLAADPWSDTILSVETIERRTVLLDGRR